MDLAPIVLFVYNRPWHTEQTLNALMQNELADQSALYIYADGPKTNATEDELKKITGVRQLLRAKQWCNEIHIIEVGENKGLANSIIEGVTELVNKYGKVIVLEDDIVTSNQFLLFMNKALEYYKPEEIVFGISGFAYPSKFPITNTHFLPIGSSWGWAIWQSRWQTVSFDSVYLKKEIVTQKKELQFDFGYCPYFKMLQDQIDGRINSWAIMFYASMFLQKKLFVYPMNSLVTNVGFDNTGTHTLSPDNFFDKVKTGKIPFQFPKPLIDQNLESVRLKFDEKFKIDKIRKQSSGFGVIKKIYKLIRREFS